MSKRIILSIFLAIAFVLGQGRDIPVKPGDDYKKIIEAAKPGDVVNMAAGTYTANALTSIPGGVSVLGAGVDKTVFRTAIGKGITDFANVQRGLAVFRLFGGNGGGQKVGRFTIDGQGRTGYGGINTQGRSNFTLEDIKIDQTRCFALISDGCTDAVYQRIYTYNSGTSARGQWSWGAVLLYTATRVSFIDNYHSEIHSYCLKAQTTLLTDVLFQGCTFLTNGTLGPWGGGSENISTEFVGVYHGGSKGTRFYNCTFDNQLSLASNFRSEYAHRIHVKGCMFIAPKNKARRPDYNMELNLHSTVKGVLIEENYFNCRQRVFGIWSAGKRSGGAVVRNNIADNMTGGGRYDAFVAGNMYMSDWEIYNNTIVHDRNDGDWAFIYLDSKAKTPSKNVKVFNNIFKVHTGGSNTWIARHDNQNGFSGGGNIFQGNVIEGFRQTNKFQRGGFASSGNIYASGELKGSGDKPLPYYETTFTDKGAQPFEIGDVVIPDLPDPVDPDPVDPAEPVPAPNEPIVQGEIVIDCGGASDKYYQGGTAYTGRGYTERYGDFQYDIPVGESDSVRVAMNLTEIFHTSDGKRRFDVFINEKRVLENYDPWQQSNGENLVVSFTVKNSNRLLKIRFESLLDNAKVNSIGVTAVNDTGPKYHYFDRPIVVYQDSTIQTVIKIPKIEYQKDSVKIN